MKGILILQLGTPRSPTPLSTAKYLSEFLMDRRVVDLPWPLRALLVYGIILPFRSSKSSHAYKSIWTPAGSPLLNYSDLFTQGVQKTLGTSARIALAMRYGEPSIESSVEKLLANGCDEILVCPMYPQYASATTGSSIEKIIGILSKRQNIPGLKILRPFYDAPFYIKSVAAVGLERDLSRFDHLLFSYHGLPERQVLKSDPSHSHCLQSKSCCFEDVSANRFCYRHHCVVTTERLARELQLRPEQFTMSFQSRLGRTPWLSPYTDRTIAELAQKGVRSLGVFCPSFVVDCLETLEEIAIRGRQTFLQHGGQHFELIPSLNDHPLWVGSFSNHLMMNESQWSDEEFRRLKVL